jgi:ubiquitin-conjugating enzyme E2 variant
MAEQIVIPRGFKLLEELENGEKGGGNGVPQAHQGFVSYGLADPEDMSLSNWTASIFGPQGTVFGDQFYALKVHCDEHYPSSQPVVTFVTKINMPGVDPRTGLCAKMPDWTRDKSIAHFLCYLRENMKKAVKLPQPPPGAEF